MEDPGRHVAATRNERDVSPGTTKLPRDVPPETHLAPPNLEEMKKAVGVGYVASPLRAQQRLASLGDKDLPNLPEDEEIVRPNKTSAVARQLGPRNSSASFPWLSPPGETHQPPTNDLVKNDLSSEAPTPVVGSRMQNAPGAGTPPHRRSVQFMRETADSEPTSTPLRKSSMWDTDPGEIENGDAAPYLKERQGSFFNKLKSLASPASSGHARGYSNSTGFVTPNVALSPQSERSEPTYALEPIEAADADAESEDSEQQDEVSEIRPKKQREKSKGPVPNGSGSAPSTPMAQRFASFIRDHQSGSNSRPQASSRRNTMSDIGESEQHAGVSEDEGRDRIRTAWRRGIEGARGLSYSARRHEEGETPEKRRPGNLRRLTGFGGAVDGSSSSPFRARADRQSSTSAQKWKQVKAGLKMLGQRKRDERMLVDHQKSAQLMAELLAGAPAALVFASMFQRDEDDNHKVPVLLEQLKIRIPHSEMRKDNSGDRHLVFRIELEYGNGPARMQWTVRRTLQDFVNLHVKYKSSTTAAKFRHLRGEDKSKAKMPRFPKSAFPYARGARGLLDKFQDEDEDQDIPENLDGEASGTDLRPTLAKHKSRKSYFGPPRRTSTGGLDGAASTDPNSLNARQREQYNDRQRKKLETYLQQMIRWLIFRVGSTRLCKFLEVSALAIRLSAEGGFQGKQGQLAVTFGASKELKSKNKIKVPLINKTTKLCWFLVRHSYVVCVDGPESLTPYDVFLVDSDFRMEKTKKRKTDPSSAGEVAHAAPGSTKSAKHHLIRLYNSERKLKMVARTERLYFQFQESLNQMVENTVWAKKQRFASFAPVRNNAWAQWLVDGRDHMWQVSRAIDNAKDFVYIHDWWLSPELYMRRPAAISQKWRLDRLLQRKAQEGVKIFVIVYRNIESAIPIDSEYTKWSLLDLHENICIQRSPNQFRQNQFFWAHHEKLVVVDNMMAFVGGVDLCFGRWDDPCHSLTDDKLTGFELDCNVPRDSEHCQVWPGKDYSNPRVQDFYALDRPYEEMYDRTKVPRMPWHDIAMQVVGQPARDLGRHFVQRWNYILRNRIPSRPTPVLIPPPEYEREELERLGMTGTCQVQMLRSCSSWSIGTPNKVEHSIMNAYCHLIKTSEHFVYIENQFFISSCVVESTPIHNKIGDALVERAIRAYENNEKWQACIVIPLMPGFQNSVDSQDGTSVRLIMQCQYRSICRGDSSIFGRLRAKGIEPEDYIRFYSLRQWGKIGPRKCITTEQLYIHAKCMVVDDRTAIIGSANINERSMLGSRDSEVAAVVTDTKMLPSFMGGNPYEVGEFTHTLRKRLMREHLGIDVDAIYRREQAKRERDLQDQEMERIYRGEENDGASGLELNEKLEKLRHMSAASTPLTERNLEANAQHTESVTRTEVSGWAGTTQAASSGSLQEPPQERTLEEQTTASHKKGPAAVEAQRDLDVEGLGFDNMKALVDAGDIGLTDTLVDAGGREVLLKQDAPDGKRVKNLEQEQEAQRQSEERERIADQPPVRPPWPTERFDTVTLGFLPRSRLPDLPTLDDTDIGGPPLTRGLSSTSANIVNPVLSSIRRPEIHEDCMQDPIVDGFYREIWDKVAENNTKLYRAVFRCMPDSEVLDWKQYEKSNDYNERFMQSQGLGSSKPRPAQDAPDKSGPPGSGGTEITGAAASIAGAKLSEGRARGKSLIGTAIGKLKPDSSAGNDTTHTMEMHDMEAQRAGSPGSLLSGESSEPTAVPSPATVPADENELVKQTDGGDESVAAGASMGPRTSKEESASFSRQRTVQYSDAANHAPETTATQSHSPSADGLQHTASQKRPRRGTTKSSGRGPPQEEILSKDEAEGLMKLVQGHLVSWPYNWLEREERGSNWLYNIDRIAPLEIYD